MELTIEQALQQGVAEHKKGKLQDAERLYRAILQSQPLHPDANHNLGVLAVSVNKVDVALPLFKTALEANPKIEQFWLSYIDALFKEKQFENAKLVIEQAKKEGLGDEKLNTLEAQLPSQTQTIISASPSQQQLNSLLEHYQNGQFGDAETLALSITYEFPSHQLGWKVLGAVYGQTGKNPEAVNANQSAAALSPQDAEVHSNLGLTLKNLGRLDEAEASYNQAIALKPDYAEAHSNLGNTLQDLGKLDEAEASYNQAIALKPDFAEAHYNLGNTLQESGRLDEAEASYNQAIALKPNYAEAHSNLGNILKELGRLDEAEASYNQAIALKPDFAEAHYNLGNTLQELGRLENAISSFTQASFIDPQNPTFYANLGLTPSLISRQPLINQDGFIKSINDGDWEGSEILLKQIFNENPNYIKEHVKEFIRLWCAFCVGLVNQNMITKLLPLFIKLFVMGERNKDLSNLIKTVFEYFDIDKILEVAESKEIILIKLIYCQYNFLKEDFLLAEALAIENIQNSESLIRVIDTEDIGWFIIRRSLELCPRKDVSRRALTNLITKLGN